MSAVNEPLEKVYSDIEAKLAPGSGYSSEILLNFRIIADTMRNNGCAQKSCSVYLWGKYDRLSLNADSGSFYWELIPTEIEFMRTGNPKPKKYELDDWEAAYQYMKESLSSGNDRDK